MAVPAAGFHAIDRHIAPGTHIKSINPAAAFTVCAERAAPLLDRIEHLLHAADQRYHDVAVLLAEVRGPAAVSESGNQRCRYDAEDVTVERLRGCVPDNAAIVSLSPNIYAVALLTSRDWLGTLDLARGVIRDLEQQEWHGNPITINVGVAFSSMTSSQPSDLLHNALLALGHAQSKGAGRFAVFHPQLHDEATRPQLASPKIARITRIPRMEEQSSPQPERPSESTPAAANERVDLRDLPIPGSEDLEKRLDLLDLAVARFEELEERRFKTLGSAVVSPLIDHSRELQSRNAELERENGRLEMERDMLRELMEDLKARDRERAPADQGQSSRRGWRRLLGRDSREA